MNLKYQITPTFKGGTFISYAVVQYLSLLDIFARLKPEPRFYALPICANI